MACTASLCETGSPSWNASPPCRAELPCRHFPLSSIPRRMIALQRRASGAAEPSGVRMNNTCINYQTTKLLAAVGTWAIAFWCGDVPGASLPDPDALSDFGPAMVSSAACR